MLKRLQKATVIVLTLCLVSGFGAEVWRASNMPHPPIKQSTSAQHKQKSNSETLEERHQATEEAIAYYNKWLMLFTAVLAVATFGLGIATIGLYFAGERQLEHAKSEAGHARFNRIREEARLNEQINIARDSADAATAAASASDRQAKVAEAALTQLERPYVFIFGVHRFQFDAETKEFFIEYTVANYGKMPAIIEVPQIGFVIDNRMQPPMPILVEESHSLMTSPIMPAGEQRKFREYMPANMTDGGVIVEVAEGQTEDGAGTGRFYPNVTHVDYFELFFRGIIQYRGPSSSGHVTGAMWWYHSGRNEFVGRGGEEYNYVK